MPKTPVIKPEEEIARAYADRLILAELTKIESTMKLSELADSLSGTGLGLAEVRSLLASNPDRFRYHDRRWVPAARLEGLGRPFVEFLRLLIERFGGPMPLSLAVTELSRVLQRYEEQVEDTIRRIAKESTVILLTENDNLALTAWAFMASEETVERAFALYGSSKEEADKVIEAVGKDFDWRAEDAASKALAATAPVSAKALGAACWLSVNSPDTRSVLIYDGKKFFGQLIDTEGFVFGADGVFQPIENTKKWLVTAVKLADKLAPTVDIEDAAPIEVKSGDVTKMVSKILNSENSVTATKLLEEFYEITPSNKTFPDDLDNLMEALKASDGIQWVGGDRFRKSGDVPDFVESVPEPFQLQYSSVTDEDGRLIDQELTDEGLSSSLRKLLLHPLAMDVLDEDIAPVSKQQPEQIRLVLKSIHRELGTFPLAQVPTNWLDSEPRIQELIFVDPQGRELQVWVNQEARLMYNLIDWWFEQPTESGAVFTLTKTNKPNVFEFAWDDQTDPVVYISSQRMEDLRNMQETTAGGSVLDILIEVMNHWPKGADFLTLLAEVNVVRRTSRRLLASILSSYQCFYQRSGSPVWHFDAKKVDLGFDKSKLKFVKK